MVTLYEWQYNIRGDCQWRQTHEAGAFRRSRVPQTLPEPDDIQAGALAPWNTLPQGERTGITLELVESRLRTRCATSTTP